MTLNLWAFLPIYILKGRQCVTLNDYVFYSSRCGKERRLGIMAISRVNGYSGSSAYKFPTTVGNDARDNTEFLDKLRPVHRVT